MTRTPDFPHRIETARPAAPGRRDFLRLAAASPLALSSLLAGCGSSGRKISLTAAPTRTRSYKVSLLFNVNTDGKSQPISRSRPRNTRRVGGRDTTGTLSGTTAAYYSQINDKGEAAWYSFVAPTDGSLLASSANVYLRRVDGSDTFIRSIPVDNGSGMSGEFALNNLSQIAFTIVDYLNNTTIVSLWTAGVEKIIATLNTELQISTLSDSGYILLGGNTLLSPDGTTASVFVSADSGDFQFLSTSFYVMNQSLDIIGSLGSDQVGVVTRAGTVIEFSIPPDAGPNPSLEASGLNDTGSAFGLITADSDVYSPDQKYLGSVRWSAPSYVPSALQPLTNVDFYSPDISYQSTAAAINNAGDVVGTCGNTLRRATLWPFGSTTPLDLNSLIPAGSGWTLYGAVGINNQGQIIGDGYYTPTDSYAAFLLTPA